MQTKLMAAIVAVVFALVASVAGAQTSTTSTMDIVRAKIQADKKLLVAANMDLSDADAAKFWPIYDDYQADLKKVNDRTLKLIENYAQMYKGGAASDDQLLKLADEKIAIDEADAQRDRTFLPRLTAALPAAKVVRYLQLESKIRAVVRYELADRIPLAQ
jgi:hypothetical protein